MSTFSTQSLGAKARLRSSPASMRSSARLRALLWLGCAGSIFLSLAIAAHQGGSAGFVAADPALATLLRAMAVIKALTGAAAAALLTWRFGHAISVGFAAAYIVGASLCLGASVLIWELTLIPAAALAFHAGLFTLLGAGFADRQSGAPTILKFPGHL